MSRPRIHLREEPLYPVQPLKAAAQRQVEKDNAARRAWIRRQWARAAQVITCEWFDPIPPPPQPPFPQPARRDVFQAPTMKRMPDWRRVLPVPDVWRPKPAPGKPQPTPALYGTRYRSSRPAYRP